MPFAMGIVKILITDTLFNEIREYINSNNTIKVIENGEDILKFRIADKSDNQ